MENIDWDSAPAWAEYVVIGICSDLLYWANDCRRQSIGIGGSYDNNIHCFEKWPIHSKRPSPAWSGEGLPPVGVVCDKCYNSPNEYYQVKIIGHDEDLAVFRWLDGPYAGELSEKRQNLNMHINNPHWSFRPIRTPEQIAADEREAAVAEMKLIAGFTVKGGCQFSKLYDAGYRKQDAK